MAICAAVRHVGKVLVAHDDDHRNAYHDTCFLYGASIMGNG